MYDDHRKYSELLGIIFSGNRLMSFSHYNPRNRRTCCNTRAGVSIVMQL